MTRQLTGEEIERLASQTGVRRIAVENFLGTLDPTIGARQGLFKVRLHVILSERSERRISVSMGIRDPSLRSG